MNQTFVSYLTRILPSRFLGFIPLYIGVEIILGFAILNKIGGIYGILSIITGHPLNFWQWLYNVLSIAALPFYISALLNITNKSKNVLKMSAASLVYAADTLLGTFFTLYFMFFWFSKEDSSSPDKMLQRSYNSNPNPSLSSTANPGRSSQSASEETELFYIFWFSLIIFMCRIYFTTILLSFCRILLKQDALDSRYNSTIEDQVAPVLSDNRFVSRYKKIMASIDLFSKSYLGSIFE